ncbi:hypothetical protein COV17_00010 [Candidatus Woesearchaeota archaeon CG10_big_fil_rev_8_21_14_0_10_36_11]|nr:MAG: hypothetical protein COV17_00010 [Candidatus Woesearchaeota archaeon CG10_big_fil_rev_8_21_14_0_10_36_11]
MYKKRLLIDKSSAISSPWRQKKGQITLFIIVGILLILALVLVVSLKTEILVFKPEELIVTEKTKVENLITTCIQTIGEDALDRIGTQGGYIDVPGNIAGDASLHLRISPMHVVPYWAYGESTNVPSLQQIKERVDTYIESNLRTCVLAEKPFQDTYDIVEQSDIIANTEIVENQVIFNVEWNLDIRNKQGETVVEVLRHVTESPIKLKRLHTMASKIIEREMTDLKLEDITQDLISLESPGVPVAGTDISCTQKVWNVPDVKKSLQQLLRVNVNKLRVKGTEYVEYPDEFPYYQNHYVWELDEEFVNPDVGVVFKYEDTYPFTFQVTPTEGNKMKSGSLGGTSIISYLCLQNWKFTYDISYPVLVQVHDETTGYVFNMAFTVHLVRNMPDRSVEIVARESATTTFVDDDKYCSQRRIPMTVTTWSLVDNGIVYDQQPLDNTDVSFSCIKYTCDLGKTIFDFAQRGYQASNTWNFPYCVGGIVRGEMEGYKEDWKRVVTKPGENVELNLVPIIKIPASEITVLKHRISNTMENSPGEEIDNDETVSIQIKYSKKDEKLLANEPYHSSSIVLSSQIDQEIINQQYLEFLAGADFTYNLQISIFNDEKLVGGYTQNWTAPWTALSDMQEMTFHAVTSDDTSNEGIFTFMAGLSEYSARVPQPDIR